MLVLMENNQALLTTRHQLDRLACAEVLPKHKDINNFECHLKASVKHIGFMLVVNHFQLAQL
jgi:hypothetical protein